MDALCVVFGNGFWNEEGAVEVYRQHRTLRGFFFAVAKDNVFGVGIGRSRSLQ